MPKFPRNKEIKQKVSGDRDRTQEDKDRPVPYQFGGETVEAEDNDPELNDDVTKDENQPEPEATPEKKKSAGPLVLSPRLMFWGSLGLAVLLIWVFTLGILVGRGSIFQSKTFKRLEDRLVRSSDQGSHPVVEVTEETVDRPVAVLPEKPELTFYESLTQSHSPPKKVADGSRPPKAEKPGTEPGEHWPEKILKPVPPETKTTPSEASGAEVPSPTAAETGTKDKIRVTSDVATVQAETSAAPPPPRRSGENFSIQVAAADSLAQAEKMVAALKARGLDAYSYQVELEGRQYFRVRVGRYETREQAKAAMAELEAKGFKKMFISALTD